MKFTNPALKSCLARVALGALCGFCALRGAAGAEIAQDFRGRPYDPALFRLTGPGASGAIHQDSRGLRIALPREHGMKPAVGIVLRSGFQGDFEITMEYEILAVEPTTGGYGAGVSLYITEVSYTKEAATIGRMAGRDGAGYFMSHRATTPAAGKREHSGGERIPAPSASGKLRLVRSDTTLTYLVADGESAEFQEIYETDLGDNDIDAVRFAADNGGSPTLVDVLIKSVSVHSDDAGPSELLPPRPSRWPLWIGLGAGVVLLGGGYWYWRQR
jgi:hypothetical protein